MSYSYSRKTSLKEAFRIQRSVVGALILREMQTRFGRHNVGFLWLFLEPLVLGTAVGAIHYVSGHTLPGGLNPFLFSLYGYVPFFVFRAVATRAPVAIYSNMTLLYHQRVTLFDIMVARDLLESGAVVGVVLLILAGASVFFDAPPANVGLVLVGMAFMVLFSHGVAMILAAASAYWESFERIVHPATYLLMPLSGAFFAASWLPPEIREKILWMPLLHVHEMIREGQFGDRIVSYYSWSYIIECCLVANMLGMMALRVVRDKLNMI